MQIKDLKRRDDMCPKGASKLYYSPSTDSNRGLVILRRKDGWYATQEHKLDLVGFFENSKLARTLGPFKSAKEALKAWDIPESLAVPSVCLD